MTTEYKTRCDYIPQRGSQTDINRKQSRLMTDCSPKDSEAMMYCFYTLNTLALIYQPSTETSADLSREIIVQQGSLVIHERFVSRQSQCMNDRMLIDAATENHHLHNHALKYSPFRGCAPRLYDMERRNTAKKRNSSLFRNGSANIKSN